MNTIKIIDIKKFTNLQACNNKLQIISIAISTSKKLQITLFFKKLKIVALNLNFLVILFSITRQVDLTI